MDWGCLASTEEVLVEDVGHLQISEMLTGKYKCLALDGRVESSRRRGAQFGSFKGRPLLMTPVGKGQGCPGRLWVPITGGSQGWLDPSGQVP